MQTAHKRRQQDQGATQRPGAEGRNTAWSQPQAVPQGSLRGAVVTRCCGTGGGAELWQVRYCTTGSKGQLWGRGPRLTALVHGWRSCCLWAFLDRQVVGRDTGAKCPRGAEGQRDMGSSSRVDISSPSILGYTGSDSSHTQDGQNAVGHHAALEARNSGLRPPAGC